MTDGWKTNELAAELGQTQSWVSEQLDNLRTAIQLQQGIFPPLSDAEAAALTESIREHGVLEPIHINYDGNHLTIIDGNHRHRIAATLERTDTIRYILHRNLTDTETRNLEYTLNATRRQLDNRTKRKLVESQLTSDPNRSDRSIAGICGVHHDTVATIRTQLAADWETWNAPPEPDLVEQLEAAAADPTDSPTDSQPETNLVATPATPPTVNEPPTPNPYQPPTRTDTTGRQQPATRDHPKTHAAPEREWTIGQVTCPACAATHTLIRVGEKHILRA